MHEKKFDGLVGIFTVCGLRGTTNVKVFLYLCTKCHDNVKHHRHGVCAQNALIQVHAFLLCAFFTETDNQ
jgi:hypothetical protein